LTLPSALKVDGMNIIRLRKQRLPWAGLWAVFILGMLTLAACESIGAEHFRDHVNEATQVKVADRYGAPHWLERLADGREVWTYFERGSGTASYGGYVTGGSCRMYTLTFDQQGVLRDWKEDRCAP
jgi:hypothetical protein